MLRPTRDLLKHAQEHDYALGAFNVYNLEGVRAAIQAAEEEQSPLMLQLHPRALSHGGLPLIDLCLTSARDARIPAAVHLDHSASAAPIAMALAAGMQSVMADGSDLSYENNVTFTRQIVEQARTCGAAVEAELGKISGSEDGLSVGEREARLTDPAQAADFVRQTGVDMLAICIGNVHGEYRVEPRLDFARLEQIRREVSIPLVMHGASGLPEAAIQQSIALGIRKFNVNTEIRQAYVRALRAAPDGADLLDIMDSAIAAMMPVVRDKLRLFGASGKAAALNT